jgi:hypothetical protein
LKVALSPSRRISILVLLAGTCACESMLSAPDYHVADFDTRGRVLASRYATGPSECVSCLTATSCGAAFERCAELPGCATFAECTREAPSPASEAECVLWLAPSDEIRDATLSLSNCYRSCVTECDVGRDFDCVGDYGWPGSLPSRIRLEQTLHYLYATGEPDAPVVGAEVDVCPPGPDCDTPLVLDEPAVTDETGTYEVSIPISTAPAALVGFRGFRQIRSDGHLPHRHQRNTPIVVDITEQTRILPHATTDGIFSHLETDAPLESMLLQAFDCRGVGAGDVFFELPDSPNAVVLYKTGVSVLSFSGGPTLASQEGAAAVVGVEAGRWHRVVARTQGLVVAEAEIYVPGDAVVLASLFPNAGGR